MPFDNQDLFKPIEVTVDPRIASSDTLRSIVKGTTVATTITTACADDVLGRAYLPEVKEVIFAPPATIVYWKDGSRTVVKCSDNDYFDEETGFVLCFMKKILGNKGNFNTYIRKSIKNAKRYYKIEPLFETPITNIVKAIKDEFKEKL